MTTTTNTTSCGICRESAARRLRSTVTFEESWQRAAILKRNGYEMVIRMITDVFAMMTHLSRKCLEQKKTADESVHTIDRARST